MAKKPVLTMTAGALRFPFIAISRVFEAGDLWNTRAAIDHCLKVVDSFDGAIPPRFIAALVAAEDHRSAIHSGVDPIAIIRALFVRIRRNRTEGASTIEQQFVRTVSGCYERSLRRKIKEQAIAIAVSRRRSKFQIASAYLSVAFYGSGCTGIVGLTKRCGGDLQSADQRTTLEMIARLKYPEPIHPTYKWRLRIERRVRYIAERISNTSGAPSRTPSWPRLRRIGEAQAELIR